MKQDEPTKPALPRPQRHYVIKDKSSRMYLGRDITKRVRELPNAQVFTESELDKEDLSKHLEYIEVKTVKVDGFGLVATRLVEYLTEDKTTFLHNGDDIEVVPPSDNGIAYCSDVSIVQSVEETDSLDSGVIDLLEDRDPIDGRPDVLTVYCDTLEPKIIEITIDERDDDQKEPKQCKCNKCKCGKYE